MNLNRSILILDSNETEIRGIDEIDTSVVKDVR